MKTNLILLSSMILMLAIPVLADENSETFPIESSSDNRWVPPPPVDESGKILKFLIQADYQQDRDLPGRAFSMIDLSAKRQLDENSVLGEGVIRFRKDLSSSDTNGSLDLRIARLSYLEPWLQVTVGRFDLFQTLTPNLFFGAYPIMGLHRVDGVMATIPFSFFFNFGPAKEGNAETSSPLALTFFYSPSLFSTQQVQYDLTQSFWLSQLRFRVETKDFVSTFRANFAGSASDYFDYSSFNGSFTYSLSADLSYQQNYNLTAEYGVQNINRSSDTGVLALGFQASRLGTWGVFSIDQIALETQIPLAPSINNPFTGGNGLTPALAQSSQTSWYVKVRTRLKVLFIELHLSNNQNDFTLGRPAPGSLGVPFAGTFGPGNETDGPGTSLRSVSYNNIACLVRTGVEF